MPIMALWRILTLAVPVLIALHLWVAPFTKVEESFNVQAAHDILVYGVPIDNVYLKFKAQYDHMTFPGAVPRTFIGALVLSALAKPVVLYGRLSLEQQQYLIRGLLGLLNAAALLCYASGVRRAFGKSTAAWYLVLQASQFHVLYYASRPLPNMFAFALNTIALRFTLPNPTSTMSQVKRARLALYLLTIATIIFRSELALLLGSRCLFMLLKSPNMGSRTVLVRTTLLPAVLTATVAGLLLTVSIDTYFWQSRKLLWPELAAFLSNVLPKAGSAGASAWGTSPWHWYFTSAIPRLLLNPLLLLLLLYGLTTTVGGSVADLLIPSLSYVALYSILPHKETRFLFPVVPSITTAVALVAFYISVRSSRSLLYRCTTIVLVVTTFITFLMSHAVLLPLSAQTYPGAHSLQSLHSLSTIYPPQQHIYVHLTNLALQTGITRFLQHPPPSSPLITLPGSPDGSRPALTSGATYWHYDKSDNASDLLTPAFWAQFDYVIVEDPGRAIGAWDVVDKVPGAGTPRIMAPDLGRGYLVLGSKEERREADGLSRLVQAMYGTWMKWVYGVVHDVLREGYGVRGLLGEKWSWTKGWWVHWGLETKLYVLKRSENWLRTGDS